MFCTNCGKAIPDGSKVCTNCGFEVVVPAQTEADYVQVGQASFTQNDCENKDSNMPESGNFADFRRTKPLSTAKFFFIQLLFLVPIVNLVFIIYWSLKKNINENLKSYARSMLIWTVVLVISLFFALLTFIFMHRPLPLSFKF